MRVGSREEEEAVMGGDDATLAPAPDANPLRPVREQGEVLLATWTSKRRGIAWSVWDSFGSQPFFVSKIHKSDVFATRGIIMRATYKGVTLVLRTNPLKQFQVCFLGTPWPAQWSRTLHAATRGLDAPAAMVLDTVVFSVVQNHVTLGREIVSSNALSLLDSLVFTADGERLKASRAAVPAHEGVDAEMPPVDAAPKMCCLCYYDTREAFFLHHVEDGPVQLCRGARLLQASPQSLLYPPLRELVGLVDVVHVCATCQPGLEAGEGPLRSVEQGTVLLAQWISRDGTELSVWDSYGTAPFVVGTTSRYVTCGVLMRATRGGATLVLRTNHARLMQMCMLGTAWPDRWFESPYKAIKAVPGLPSAFHLDYQCFFSKVHNHVLLGCACRLPRSLLFTAEGERLKADRAAAPPTDPAVTPRVHKKAKTVQDDNDDGDV